MFDIPVKPLPISITLILRSQVMYLWNLEEYSMTIDQRQIAAHNNLFIDNGIYLKWSERFRSGERIFIDEELINLYKHFLPTDNYTILSSEGVFTNGQATAPHKLSFFLQGGRVPSYQFMNVFPLVRKNSSFEDYKTRFTEDFDYIPTILLFGIAHGRMLNCWIIDGHQKFAAAVEQRRKIRFLVAIKREPDLSTDTDLRRFLSLPAIGPCYSYSFIEIKPTITTPVNHLELPDLLLKNSGWDKKQQLDAFQSFLWTKIVLEGQNLILPLISRRRFIKLLLMYILTNLVQEIPYCQLLIIGSTPFLDAVESKLFQLTNDTGILWSYDPRSRSHIHLTTPQDLDPHRPFPFVNFVISSDIRIAWERFFKSRKFVVDLDRFVSAKNKDLIHIGSFVSDAHLYHAKLILIPPITFPELDLELKKLRSDRKCYLLGPFSNRRVRGHTFKHLIPINVQNSASQRQEIIDSAALISVASINLLDKAMFFLGEENIDKIPILVNPTDEVISNFYHGKVTWKLSLDQFNREMEYYNQHCKWREPNTEFIPRISDSLFADKAAFATLRPVIHIRDLKPPYFDKFTFSCQYRGLVILNRLGSESDHEFCSKLGIPVIDSTESLNQFYQEIQQEKEAEQRGDPPITWQQHLRAIYLDMFDGQVPVNIIFLSSFQTETVYRLHRIMGEHKSLDVWMLLFEEIQSKEVSNLKWEDFKKIQFSRHCK